MTLQSASYPLAWTTDPPTVPGYYWVSWKVGWNFADEIVRVRFRRRNCRDTDELIVAPVGTEAQYNLDIAQMWAGPIPEPQHAEAGP